MEWKRRRDVMSCILGAILAKWPHGDQLLQQGLAIFLFLFVVLALSFDILQLYQSFS